MQAGNCQPATNNLTTHHTSNLHAGQAGLVLALLSRCLTAVAKLQNRRASPSLCLKPAYRRLLFLLLSLLSLHTLRGLRSPFAQNHGDASSNAG